MEIGACPVTSCLPNTVEPYSSRPSNVVGLSVSLVSRCQNGDLVSTYSHDNVQLGTHLYFNCYGLIKYILENTCPGAYRTVEEFMNARKDGLPVSLDGIPCPFHYAAFFSSLKRCTNEYWETFQNSEDVKPGDLIVYLPWTLLHKPLMCPSYTPFLSTRSQVYAKLYTSNSG